MLWTRAAQGGDAWQQLSSALASTEDGEAEKKRQRLQLIDALPQIATATCARFGLVADFETIAPLSEDEIEQAMYEDFLADGAL
jgi:hypothetical protein